MIFVLLNLEEKKKQNRTYDLKGNPAICFVHSYVNTHVSLTGKQEKNRGYNLFHFKHAKLSFWINHNNGYYYLGVSYV